MAVVRSPDFLRALIRETALATLIHQRRLTPSCGGQAPTAERTVGPARMIAESLTSKPGIREHNRGKTGQHLLNASSSHFDPFRSSAQPKSRTATGTQRAPEWHLAVRPSARDARHQPRRSCRIPRGYTLRQRFFDLIHRAG